MQKIISLTVDFQKAVKYTPEKIVKGDYSGVVMEFDIVQDITDHTVRVAFETANGTSYLLDCVNVDGKAVLELPSGVLSVIGVVNCQIAVYDLDSRLTNPMGFYFFVVDDLSDGAISTSDDVPILMDLITQVNDIINTFEGATWEIFNEGVI